MKTEHAIIFGLVGAALLYGFSLQLPSTCPPTDGQLALQVLELQAKLAEQAATADAQVGHRGGRRAQPRGNGAPSPACSRDDTPAACPRRGWGSDRLHPPGTPTVPALCQAMPSSSKRPL